MIKIQVTNFSYRIPVSPHGVLYGAQININEYISKFNDWEFNFRTKKWFIARRYVYYNTTTEMLYLPKYDLPAFLEFLKSYNLYSIIAELPVHTGRDVDISLVPEFKPKSELQSGAIDYLSSSTDCLRGLSLQTGKGKTAITIAALANINKRTFITVGGLVDQWVDSVKRFTTLDDKDIFVIQGNGSLADILSKIDKSISPKIIICSLGTLRNYCFGKDTYMNYPLFEELFSILDIGVHVNDETHLNFFTNFIFDLRVDVAVKIVLSATFSRSNAKIRDIFDHHYPVSIRYGEGQYHKYVNIIEYSYATRQIPRHAWWTSNGYNSAKYEKWLLNKKCINVLHGIYTSVYRPSVESYYINVKKPGHKMLILCTTENMCIWIRDQLRKDHPSYTCDVYVYDTPESVIYDNDIIVSTPGSAGTGKDIANLLVVLVTLCTKSDSLNKQMLGRIRDLEDAEASPTYINAYNRTLASHVTYHEHRRSIFQNLGKTYAEYTAW